MPCQSERALGRRAGTGDRRARSHLWIPLKPTGAMQCDGRLGTRDSETATMSVSVSGRVVVLLARYVKYVSMD
jgi:hypothetical protein